MSAVWQAVVLGRALSDDHLTAALDGALAPRGRRAVEVRTHVDRSSAVARTVVSWRTDGHPADDARVATDLDGEVLGPAGDGPPPPWLDGSGGRCVRFPGDDALSGVHPVAEIVAVTAIDRVDAVGGGLDGDSPVDTLGGWLRPTVVDGQLVLLVEPAEAGRWRPVEIRDPHQCCGGAH
ncbi:hypothetical protein GB931_21390 [Modestobacter sp. I12A-02628]|uniref:Uncharacterized protein n=1 Tax=Goekera deserti TaxID=2497753 RepID=A0A7K3W8Y1_9ACTN|nr:hypothetical protein [Goekera deserti]MPR00429.1 hypothetical protein [Goekera deserti]NDI49174.1 hypothetical protein [Goekera deserti]NEL52912.1 hypothetical protein [Goekera deserti]